MLGDHLVDSVLKKAKVVKYLQRCASLSLVLEGKYALTIFNMQKNIEVA